MPVSKNFSLVLENIRPIFFYFGLLLRVKPAQAIPKAALAPLGHLLPTKRKNYMPEISDKPYPRG